MSGRGFPSPWTVEDTNDACFVVTVLRRRPWAALGGETAHAGRGAKDRGGLCQVARPTEGATSLALILLTAELGSELYLAQLAEKAPNVMLYLELPEGLQGSKIPFKRFNANIL